MNKCDEYDVWLVVLFSTDRAVHFRNFSTVGINR